MEYIDINNTVYNLCNKYPKIKDILYSLGFHKIGNPLVFNTAGKIMTIKKAMKMKNIGFNELKNKFNEYGFDFKEEYILSADDRNAILKSLILRLHNGEDIEKLKIDFDSKLIKVSADEVHRAMDELIDDGMSIDEAKRFFYMRSILLKDSINLDTIDSYKVLDIFKEENREIEKLLNNINDNLHLIDELYNKVVSHYYKKESLLFTALKKYGNDEPSKVMSKVDKDIINELKYVKGIIEEGIYNNYDEDIRYLKDHISDMIFKEENILIPLTASVLSKEDFYKMECIEN